MTVTILILSSGFLQGCYWWDLQQDRCSPVSILITTPSIWKTWPFRRTRDCLRQPRDVTNNNTQCWNLSNTGLLASNTLLNFEHVLMKTLILHYKLTRFLCTQLANFLAILKDSILNFVKWENVMNADPLLAAVICQLMSFYWAFASFTSSDSDFIGNPNDNIDTCCCFGY